MQSGEISNKRLLYPQAERVSPVSETAKMPLTYVNKEKQACLFTSPHSAETLNYMSPNISPHTHPYEAIYTQTHDK